MNIAGSGSCPIRRDSEPSDIATREIDCIFFVIRLNLLYTQTLLVTLDT
jgi:hypothetical protein